MASTTLNELPPIRPSSRISNTNSTISSTPTLRNESESTLDTTQTEEPQNGLRSSVNTNDTVTSSSSSLSRKSSTQDIQFSIDSLAVIRTVGTGTFGRVQLVLHRETNTYYALKVMCIKRIVESKQVEHVRNEKKVLTTTDHPFLVRLQWTAHNNTLLYLLLEYLPGGEL
ncbi:unnamed protein product, partial [Adineta steineri]